MVLCTGSPFPLAEIENSKSRQVTHLQCRQLSDQLSVVIVISQSLTFPKQALVFMCFQYKSFKITMGKGEIA